MPSFGFSFASFASFAVKELAGGGEKMIRTLATVVTVTLAASPALAQTGDYPNRPIRVITGAPGGSGSDTGPDIRTVSAPNSTAALARA